jgi:hypothetical protein
MFDELFRQKTVDIQKAILFGFVQSNSNYIYETDILDGSFLLQIVITPDGNIDTKLTEKAIGDEYVLYKTNATGSFVGEVRSAIEAILKQVAKQCYNTEIFKSAQAKEIICYVREKYGDELEFLWEKFPDNAIWRRKDNEKWYGALLTVKANKLGLDDDKPIEILDLRIITEDMEATVDNQRFFMGYHMNKKHWYTLLLDGSIPTEEICRRIDESYLLAKK